MAASEPRIHVMHREGKQGLGTAYIAGFHGRSTRPTPSSSSRWTPTSHTIQSAISMRMLRNRSSICDLVLGQSLPRGRDGGQLAPVPKTRSLSFGANYLHGVSSRACHIKDCHGWLQVLPSSHAPGSSPRQDPQRRLWLPDRDELSRVEAGLPHSRNPIIFTDRVQGESKMSRRIILEAAWMVWRLRFSGRS